MYDHTFINLETTRLRNTDFDETCCVIARRSINYSLCKLILVINQYFHNIRYRPALLLDKVSTIQFVYIYTMNRDVILIMLNLFRNILSPSSFSLHLLKWTELKGTSASTK